MRQQDIIRLAKRGRPDLAALNAGLIGRPRLAAYVAKFPHACGVRFTTRELVTNALRAARCARHNRDVYGESL